MPPSFLAGAVSPFKVEVLFSVAMTVDSAFHNPNNYAITEVQGGIPLPVVSVTSSGTRRAILELDGQLSSKDFYTIVLNPGVISLTGDPVSPNTHIFQWADMSLPRGPLEIPIKDFSGKVVGGLLGNSEGLVFFTPAYNTVIDTSTIEVDSVSACTMAYDEYHLPAPPDPVPLMTFGGSGLSLIGPGTVLWAPADRLGQARIDLKYDRSDTFSLVTDIFPVGELTETIDILKASFLNDSRWKLYPGGTFQFKTASNLSSIGPGPTTPVSFGGVGTLSPAVADSISIIDEVQNIQQLSRVFADTITLQDLIDRGLVMEATPSDSISVTDTITNNYAVVAPEFVNYAIDTSTSGSARTPNLSAITLQGSDILIAGGQNRGAAGAATCSAPAGQGWTAISELTQSATGISEAWFWKRWGAGDTDDTTPTFTWSTGGNVNTVAIVVLRNCKATGVPYTITPVRVNHASNATLTTPTVATPPAATDMVIWGFQAIDDNTLINETRGDLIFSVNLSTFASMALVYEIGVDSSVNTCSMTESTNGPDAARVFTLVIEGGPEVDSPPFELTLLSTTGYGSYKTNATGWQQCSVISDPTPRSGYYWRYAAWYDRAPSPESRLWLAKQRRPAASEFWETVTTQAVATGLNDAGSAADPHLSPSIAVDETGRVVLFWNAHWDEFQYAYWRGSAPGDINVTTGSLATGLPPDLSYPKLFLKNDGLCLTARIGVGGAGTQGLWELNSATGNWNEVTQTMISFGSGSPYMQHVHVNPATDLVHFSFINATDQYTAAYRDVYYFVGERSGGVGSAWTWRALAGGSSVSLPITDSSTYLAWATGLDRGLQVHQGLSSTAGDVPLISVFYAKDGAIDRTGGSNRYLITRDGGTWVRQLVHEVHPQWNLIGGNGNHYDPNAANNEYPQASPANVLYDSTTGAVHLIYRTNYTLGGAGIPALMVTTSASAPYTSWSTPQILVDTPIGDSGPTHDANAWNHLGKVTLLATLCDVANQYSGGADANVYIADATLP